MTDRWLIIAHEATYTGASRMLSNVLRAVQIASGPDWNCEILLDREGPLAVELAQFGTVHRLSHPWAEGRGLGAKCLRGLIDRPWLKPWRLRKHVQTWHSGGAGVIYSSTATNGRLLAALPRDIAGVVTHVHELGYGLRRFNRPQDLAVTLARTDRFLAVSSAVATDLRELGVASGRISVVPNFLPILPPEPDQYAARTEVCRRLNLPLEARLVVGCGYIDPLKGTDLFVEMASLLATRMKVTPVFIWLGRDADRGFAHQIRAAAPAAVRFTGEMEDPETYFAAAEVVAVTSRVESFSLVALEAGALGRPVVAYAAARGPADLLGFEALVPELDAAAMAMVVERLLHDPEEAQRQGRALRVRIADNFLAKHWSSRLIAAVEGVGHV